MNSSEAPAPPKGWGGDGISSFIEMVRHNCLVTFAKLRPEYSRIERLDAIFRTLTDNLSHTPDWFPALFFPRAHSSFRAAAQLAMAGQFPEAHALLRVTLEHALYGFYVARKPYAAELWLKRHDSEEALRKVRDEFKITNLIQAVAKESSDEAALARTLYDHAIEYGAHPNERSLTRSLKVTPTEDQVRLDVVQVSSDLEALRACLGEVAQVGVSVLGVFRLVFVERFDLLGLTRSLDAMRRPQ